jgi:catechol 2,3-dioxygenase-like lactoylglutathione lyase family enzyme
MSASQKSRILGADHEEAPHPRRFPMIGYTTLGTNDIDKARAFYSELLALVGAKELMRFDSGFTMYGPSFGEPSLCVTKPYDGKPATVGNGVMVALLAGSRANVDALHAKALALGGTCEGKPGLRSEEGPQAYYGAYFRDADSNKLCAFHVGPK